MYTMTLGKKELLEHLAINLKPEKLKEFIIR